MQTKKIVRLVAPLYRTIDDCFTDGYIVSFRKTGRTWVGNMLSYYFALALNKKNLLEEFWLDPVPKKITRFSKYPNIKLTHDTHNFKLDKPYIISKRYKTKPTVLIVRNPIDTLISLHFHRIARVEKMRKSGIKVYDIDRNTIDDSVLNDRFNYKEFVKFYNTWAEKLDKDNILLIRFEDLKHNPSMILKQILKHFGITPRNDLVEQAVLEASFDSLQQKELQWRKKKNKSIKKQDFRTRKGSTGQQKKLTSDTLKQIQVELQRLDPQYKYNFDDESLAI